MTPPPAQVAGLVTGQGPSVWSQLESAALAVTGGDPRALLALGLTLLMSRSGRPCIDRGTKNKRCSWLRLASPRPRPVRCSCCHVLDVDTRLDAPHVCPAGNRARGAPPDGRSVGTARRHPASSDSHSWNCLPSLPSLRSSQGSSLSCSVRRVAEQRTGHARRTSESLRPQSSHTGSAPGTFRRFQGILVSVFLDEQSSMWNYDPPVDLQLGDPSYSPTPQCQ